MQIGALQALEFQRIVEVVQSCAQTPTGSARLAGLRPQTDPRRVQHLLHATSECVGFLAGNGEITLRAPDDLDEMLGALAVEGRPLEPLRLLALAEYLDSIDGARQGIQRAAGTFPILRGIVEPSATFKSEIAEVRRKIEASGEIPDSASADLRAIRERLRRLKARLRGTLESYLRGKDTAKYLQEQVVTERNGRYVLVIKAEHRAAIPGIVHGSSSSGASLFLEPLSTVEVNNDIVALEEQEAEEIRRILLSLSDGFRRRAADLQRTLEVGTELDVVQAKARFAHLVQGIEPAVTADEGIELRSARHPLLTPAVVARLGGEPPTAEPVPIDVVLKPPVMTLVITGPNTGGKTVALKTMGLVAIMAQAGLHIPAAPGSRLPVFRSIFADIGDEQSISASLSTFSAHVRNLVAVDRSLALPGLVLLDEVGAGTDPVEGGALGIAVIDHFRQRGAHVLATTHYDTLKTYASTTPGVSCAAFGFDAETFAPTYRLMYGSPGRSLALEIAGRLGLNPSILERARENVSAREAQLAAHLAKMDQEMRELDHERRLVTRERETLEAAESRLRVRDEALRQREDVNRRRLDDQLEKHLRDARTEIDRVVEDLKRRASALTAEAARRASAGRQIGITTGEAGSVRLEARSALDEVRQRFRQPTVAASAATQAPGRPVVPGDRVAVQPLGLEGIVLSIHESEVEVDISGKRLRSHVRDVRAVTRPAPVATVSVNVNLKPRGDSLATDLNVIGCSVDEAIARTEKFLDDSLLSDQRVLRVIHGHGTGQLRRAIASFLEAHPLVAHFSTAPPEQGGGGVTVVELKE
ncbi:MAG: endonuclease MutS2 [Acidobacteria bacterium]|nr:endonuclease MutS2 [Acidobacteriota bacterium]